MIWNKIKHWYYFCFIPKYSRCLLFNIYDYPLVILLYYQKTFGNESNQKFGEDIAAYINNHKEGSNTQQYHFCEPYYSPIAYKWRYEMEKGLDQIKDIFP